jgi:hypothetical protein
MVDWYMLPGMLELSKATTSSVTREELQTTVFDVRTRVSVCEIEYMNDPMGDEKSLRLEFST